MLLLQPLKIDVFNVEILTLTIWNRKLIKIKLRKFSRSCIVGFFSTLSNAPAHKYLKFYWISTRNSRSRLLSFLPPKCQDFKFRSSQSWMFFPVSLFLCSHNFIFLWSLPNEFLLFKIQDNKIVVVCHNLFLYLFSLGSLLICYLKFNTTRIFE